MGETNLRRWTEFPQIFARRSWGILLGAVLWGMVRVPVEGDDVPSPHQARRAQMARFLDDLRSPDFSLRIAAEKGLQELGPSILEDLPSLTEVKTPSQKAALQRLREYLEREAIQRRRQPTIVDIQPGLELAASLEKWREETGNVFLPPVSSESDLVISGLPQRLPYWLAIQELERRENLQADYDEQARRWRFRLASKISQSTTRVTTDGVLQGRLRLREIQPVEKEKQLLRYEFDLAYEPRLRPLFATFAMADVKFRTTADQQAVAWNPAAQYEILAANSGGPLVGRFDVLASSGMKAESLGITLPVMVHLSVGSQRLAISQSALAPGASLSQGPVSLQIDRVEWPAEDSSGQLAIEIRVIWEVRGPPFESHRTWVYHNAAYWEAAEDARMAPTQIELLQQSPEGVRLRYQFSGKELERGGGRFVYEAPTLVTPEHRTLHWEPVKEVKTEK